MSITLFRKQRCLLKYMYLLNITSIVISNNVRYTKVNFSNVWRKNILTFFWVVQKAHANF